MFEVHVFIRVLTPAFPFGILLLHTDIRYQSLGAEEQLGDVCRS